MTEDSFIKINSYTHFGWIVKLISGILFLKWTYFIIIIVSVLNSNDGIFVMNVLFAMISMAILLPSYFVIAEFFFWAISGKERVSFTNGKLKVSKSNFIYKREKVFDLNHVKNLNQTNHHGLFVIAQGNPFISFTNGSIRFDYGMKTYRFASGLNPRSATKLLDRLRKNENFKPSHFE